VESRRLGHRQWPAVVPGSNSAAADASDPLAALRALPALAERNGTALLLLHQFHRFLANPEQAEADLNTVYADIKADARQRLGRLYDPSDYPPELRGLFGLDWDFPSVEPPNYLLRIAPEVYEQEQQRIAHRFEEAVELAEQAFLTEFARLVSHLTERLSSGCDSERKIFRDSAVTNLADFFEKFRHLNVRSNAQLDELVEQAQRVVQGVEAQELRDNEGLRQHVAT